MKAGDKITIYDINNKPVDIGIYDGAYLANEGTQKEVTVYSATGRDSIGYLSIDGYYFIANPISPYLTPLVWLGIGGIGYLMLKSLRRK